MSEGAGGGAPAAGGAPGGAAGADVGTGEGAKAPVVTDKGKQPEKGKKPAAAAAEAVWGEKDDADFIERLKRSPYGKLKVDGKDEAIDSVDALKRTFLDAQRGKGANRLVEQTKKDAADAKAAREEHAAHKALIERARRGDVAARRELGLVPDQERAELEEKWKALPPEVQETYRRNHELEQKLSAVEKEKADRAAEETAKTKKLARDQTMAKAKGYIEQLLKDVDPKGYDVELPEMIGAMHALAQTAQRIGVDYTPEQLNLYVQQRREASVNARVAAMKPDAAMRLALPHLKALVSTPEGLAQLEEVLGVDFEGVFKPISDHRLKKWKASKTKEALKPPTKEEQREKDLEREPLSPFRRF